MRTKCSQQQYVPWRVDGVPRPTYFYEREHVFVLHHGLGRCVTILSFTQSKYSFVFVFVFARPLGTALLHIFLGTMMMLDHDEFLPAVVMMSHTPCHVNIRRQYDGTNYNDNAQQAGARSNSTERTTLPLPCESQRTHLSNVNVHNDRPIADSAHFAQPKSHDST